MPPASACRAAPKRQAPASRMGAPLALTSGLCRRTGKPANRHHIGRAAAPARESRKRSAGAKSRLEQSRANRKSEPRRDNIDQAHCCLHCRTCPRHGFDRGCAEPPADRLPSAASCRASLGPGPDQPPQCRPGRARLQYDLSGLSDVRLAEAFAVELSAIVQFRKFWQLRPGERDCP